MTPTAQAPVPVVQVPPERPRKSRKLRVTAGAVLATVGGCVALGGAGLLAVAGDDGTVGSGGPHHISTPTAALVSDTAEFDKTGDLATALGQPKLGITVTADDGGAPKFVGIGRAGDVDRYLAGVEVDRVKDADAAPFKLDKERRSGDRTAAAPTTQKFWVAQSAGHRADVDWKVKDGEYKFVVMNADGSRGVVTESQFEIEIPHLSTIAIVALILGLVTIGGGVARIAPSLKSGSGSTKPEAPTQYEIG
jgi:hypothetical protein